MIYVLHGIVSRIAHVYSMHPSVSYSAVTVLCSGSSSQLVFSQHLGCTTKHPLLLRLWSSHLPQLKIRFGRNLKLKRVEKESLKNLVLMEISEEVAVAINKLT